MKKILSVITIASASLVACNSSGSTKDTAAEKDAVLAAYRDSIKMAADTAGFAEFRNWKAQSELGETQLNQNQTAAAPVVQTRNYTPARSASRSTATRRSSSASSSNGTVYNSTSGQAAKKKGWSKAAKGAVIGGAGGAVIGGVVNKKNRAAGAVIGGVLGAGVGYGVGRSKDKKDGRY